MAYFSHLLSSNVRMSTLECDLAGNNSETVLSFSTEKGWLIGLRRQASGFLSMGRYPYNTLHYRGKE